MLHWQSILNCSLQLKLVLYSSIKQLSELCKIDYQYIVLEIDSIINFDNFPVPRLV